VGPDEEVRPISGVTRTAIANVFSILKKRLHTGV
jgi:hypothetical protein